MHGWRFASLHKRKDCSRNWLEIRTLHQSDPFVRGDLHPFINDEFAAATSSILRAALRMKIAAIIHAHTKNMNPQMRARARTHTHTHQSDLCIRRDRIPAWTMSLLKVPAFPLVVPFSSTCELKPSTRTQTVIPYREHAHRNSFNIVDTRTDNHSISSTRTQTVKVNETHCRNVLKL